MSETQNMPSRGDSSSRNTGTVNSLKPTIPCWALSVPMEQQEENQREESREADTVFQYKRHKTGTFNKHYLIDEVH